MKVLIACEESQTVCKAFRALGYEAYSCDVQEPCGGHPEWRGGRLNISRYYDGLCGKALFLAIWAADCDRVVIENPTPQQDI